MFYIKSKLTNQVYKVEKMPEFGGYELANQEEYENYCLKVFGKII